MKQECRPTQHHVAARFERDLSEIGRARRFVRSVLHQWGLDAHVGALELAVSELVTNALVHGAGAIDVALAAEGGQVRLEVTDEGHVPEPPRPVAAPEAETEDGGWGLRFVSQLADRWGATSDDARTRVWLVKRTAERVGGQDGDRPA